MTDLAEITRQFIHALPYAREMQMRIDALGAGEVTISMPYDPRLVGDPATGVLHGGAVFALMDTACGAAVMCAPEAPVTTATLDLRVDYMRPATAGQRLTARAECYHVTRTVAFVRVITSDDDPSRPVASGTGAFTFEQKAGAA